MDRRTIGLHAALALLGSGCHVTAPSHHAPVQMVETTISLPTYAVDRPDPNPRFYSGRVYQGAQGRVYPYPMLDDLTDELGEQTYRALYLENEYLRLCILPELGGRIFEAVDKTSGYDFLYRQHVVKPALIGMLGAWISGGIEWNFPHHHRSRAFLPMHYALRENADGSKTIWLSEIEIRQRMRFTLGVTLRPGRSYFEVTVRPFNRTPLPQSFLYWANVAVHARSGEYQVIFPPGTRFATQHGKREFVRWPVADGTYAGVNYAGVDLRWWKNHPAPVSFFAWNREDDFLAGYDHAESAGVVYVADHHAAPGKKFWEWGPGPRGRMWDAILTDDDGPYVELMAGAWSDNQPDYGWIQPYESREVSQAWYPIREIGGVENATLEAAVHLEAAGDIATVGFHATGAYRGARATLVTSGQVLLDRRIDIDPGTPFLARVALPGEMSRTELCATLCTADGRELVSYQPRAPTEAEPPEIVTPPPAPPEVETVEELYLAGLRLEQFHNAALSPLPYWEEALVRDPGESRVRTAVGLHELRRGRFEAAREHLRLAVERATQHHTTPKDAEALHALGLVLQLQGKEQEAFDVFSRASWSLPLRAASSYHLAQLSCRRGDFPAALAQLEQSLETNSRNGSAHDLRAAVLRHLGRPLEALAQAHAVLEEEPLDLWARYEQYEACLAAGREQDAARALESVQELALDQFSLAHAGRAWHEARFFLEAQPFLETALDYGHAGLWDEALGVLSIVTAPSRGRAANRYPMLYYLAGWLQEQAGNAREAVESYREAARMPADYGFPSRLESIAVLRAAIRTVPDDARAHYLLGNLLYDLQPAAALLEWERARDGGEQLATLQRNLAVAHLQVENDVERALASMERAVARDGHDPRLLHELDVVSEMAGVAPRQRLERLRRHRDVVAGHNDARTREVVLLTLLGHYDEAIGILETSHFRKWEGVGNIHTTYVDAHLLRGLRSLRDGRARQAIADFEAALEYPANLEVARPYDGGRECEVEYLLGRAHAAAGDDATARIWFERCVTPPRPAGPSALDYSQGMAHLELGDVDQAHRLFEGLVAAGQRRLETLETASSVEYFAKFGTRRSPTQQEAEAWYRMGLGQLGSERYAEAREAFDRALALDSTHVWAAARRASLE